jgi:Cdc6-like AAA superfamily ATPase
MHEIPIKPFSIAPLVDSEELRNYSRLPELVQSVSNEIGYSKGGCFLITGYRGIGKTSFVNKVIQTSADSLKPNTTVLPVRLNLARGYSTDKLLRRLIRELYYALKENGIYEHLDNATQEDLYVAFLKTSRQIKMAYAQGLKNAFSETETNTLRESGEAKIEPSLGIKDVAGLSGSFTSKREKESSKEITRSNEESTETGIDVELLEYDDEIAENDLSHLINLLYERGFKDGNEPKQESKVIQRKPAWFWKIIANIFPKIQQGKTINIIIQKPIIKRIKLVFILDEIDKMDFKEAEDIFRSLKSLFLKGNVFFFVITGKVFYYEWLRKRTSEDDIFFSLFTRIIHIRLFSENEFESIARQLSNKFPKNLLMHLMYKAKGTPREFYRELSRFVDWSDQQPKLIIPKSSETLLKISAELYPIIQAQYHDIEIDTRIDIGIKDHLHRSFHNWMEWMTILVTFTRLAVLRPKTEGETEDALFLGRTQQAFDNLFQAMLEIGVIADTNQKIQDERVFSFSGPIRGTLQEVDSTISGRLQSTEIDLMRRLNQLALDFSLLLEKNELVQAQSLLEQIREIGPDDSKQYSRSKELLETRKRMSEGDRLFEEGLYDGALRAYQLVHKQSNRNNIQGIDAKIVRTKLVSALQFAKNAIDLQGYESARNRLLEANQSSFEVFEPEIVKLQEEAREKVKTLEHITDLIMKLQKLNNEKLYDGYSFDLQKLKELAPNYEDLPLFEARLKKDLSEINFIDRARESMLMGDYVKSRDYAIKAMASKDIETASLARELYINIQTIIGK